jgi:amino acid permease
MTRWIQWHIIDISEVNFRQWMKNERKNNPGYLFKTEKMHFDSTKRCIWRTRYKVEEE